MRGLSVAEQRYQAVLEVILQGRTGPEVAEQWQVSTFSFGSAMTSRFASAGRAQR